MSRPNPNQYEMDSANKSASLAIPGVSRHNWMVTANNMPDHTMRSCGHKSHYDLVLPPERNKRTNALAHFAVLTNGTQFSAYFPAANVPDGLPTDPKNLGHVWIENACQLAEKTWGNVQQAHRHITEAVRLRSGDPGEVMVAKDFLAARELAILEEGKVLGLAQGRAEGRKEILEGLGMTEDDAFDLIGN